MSKISVPLPDRFALEHHLPQVCLDQYNRQFTPATYNAFRDAVREALPSDMADPYIDLFIDSCLEQCGTPQYFGCTRKLRSLLSSTPFSSTLLPLMDAHLAHFSPPPDLPLYMELNDMLISHIGRLAEIANGQAGWRARAAYAWLVSAEYALRAARAIYVNRDHLSYVQEKAGMVGSQHEAALFELEHPDDERA